MRYVLAVAVLTAGVAVEQATSDEIKTLTIKQAKRLAQSSDHLVRPMTGV